MGITHVYSPDGSGIPGVHVCPQWFSRRRSLSRAISCDGDLRSPSSGRSGLPLFCTRTRTPIEIRDYREQKGGGGDGAGRSGFFSMTEHRPRGLSSPFSSLPFTFRPRVHRLSKIRTLERRLICSRAIRCFYMVYNITCKNISLQVCWTTLTVHCDFHTHTVTFTHSLRD